MGGASRNLIAEREDARHRGEDRLVIEPMDVLEIAYGNPIGEVEARPAPATAGDPPAAVVRRLVIDALLRPPCLVVLSAEHESRRLLQLTLRIAREEGLAAPCPVWVEPQEGPARRGFEARARELGAPDVIVARVPREDLGILGGPAQDILRARGSVFPASVGHALPLVRAAHGGSLLIAQNASQLWRFWRGRPLAEVAHGARPGRALLRTIAVAHAPLPVRRRAVRGFSVGWAPEWMRPESAAALRARLVEDAIRSPLTWSDAIRRGWSRRCERMTNQLFGALGAEHDVRVLSVLDHPAVLDALARHGGRTGFGGQSRTWDAVMPATEIWAPGDVDATPASSFGERETAFADTWDGTGLDGQVFDAEALRAAWRTGATRSALALQAAWLAHAG